VKASPKKVGALKPVPYVGTKFTGAKGCHDGITISRTARSDANGALPPKAR
jgi:hypothetical protein